MPLDPDRILGFMLARARELRVPRRCVIAYSGGRDSTVLLALMAELAPKLGTRLLAVHVNHKLQAEADSWQLHCQAQAAAFSVEFRAIEVTVSGDQGPEGNARMARYRALGELLADGDWLLTAHHQEDQAETLLLNLMRGSGVDGLRGIAACRVMGRGFLLRPLLMLPAADIEEWGRHRELQWIDDPSNKDLAFDRNFLRQELVPMLISRWPAASRQLARSAQLLGDAATLVGELAALDLQQAGSANRLSIEALGALSDARRRSLLRYACGHLQLPMPPARQLSAIVDELLPARPDASPCVEWPGAEARRYRDHLYLLSPLPDAAKPPQEVFGIGSALPLGPGLGVLSICTEGKGGVDLQALEAGLTVKFREGGELFEPHGRGISKTLKQLFQEAGVVPWMRGRVPLLYSAQTLVAVGDLWVADAFYRTDGKRIVWQEKPAIL